MILRIKPFYKFLVYPSIMGARTIAKWSCSLGKPPVLDIPGIGYQAVISWNLEPTTLVCCMLTAGSNQVWAAIHELCNHEATPAEAFSKNGLYSILGTYPTYPNLFLHRKDVCRHDMCHKRLGRWGFQFALKFLCQPSRPCDCTSQPGKASIARTKGLCHHRGCSGGKTVLKFKGQIQNDQNYNSAGMPVSEPISCLHSPSTLVPGGIFQVALL